jgi:hypothetical protein
MAPVGAPLPYSDFVRTQSGSIIPDLMGIAPKGMPPLDFVRAGLNAGPGFEGSDVRQ